MAKTTKFLAILTVLALLTVFYSCAMSDNDTKGARTNLNDKPLEPAEPTEPVEEPTEPEQKGGTFPDLDAETELQIKQDYMIFAKLNPERGWTVDLVWILGFFGIYNDCIPLYVDIGRAFTGWGSVINVAGFKFYFDGPSVIEIWKKGANGENGYFYKLNEAYDLGFLTDEDIKNIHYSFYYDPYAWNPPKFR